MVGPSAGKSPPSFVVGERVIVSGDSVAPELQGLEGVILRVSAKGGNSYWFRVLLDNGRDLYFTAKQLVAGR
jgi:hypothetical protein